MGIITLTFKIYIMLKKLKLVFSSENFTDLSVEEVWEKFKTKELYSFEKQYTYQYNNEWGCIDIYRIDPL